MEQLPRGHRGNRVNRVNRVNYCHISDKTLVIPAQAGMTRVF